MSLLRIAILQKRNNNIEEKVSLTIAGGPSVDRLSCTMYPTQVHEPLYRSIIMKRGFMGLKKERVRKKRKQGNDEVESGRNVLVEWDFGCMRSVVWGFPLSSQFLDHRLHRHFYNH